MTEECDLAWLGHGAGDGGVQASHWAHDPQAVRADDPNPAAPRLFHDLPFERCAFGPELLEPGRDDDHRPNSGLDAFADQVGHCGRGRGHDGQVDRVGHGSDARVDLNPQHATPLRIYRKNGPAERAADQVPHEGPADAAGLLGRPDDGDVLGREARLQAASPLGAEQAGGKIFCGLAARSAHGAVSLPKLPKISQYNVVNPGKIPDHFGDQHAGATDGHPGLVAC